MAGACEDESDENGGAAMTAEEQRLILEAVNEAAPYLVFTITLIVGAIIAR